MSHPCEHCGHDTHTHVICATQCKECRQKRDSVPNVGKCGHARCAGGNGCYEKGRPMANYEPVTLSRSTVKCADCKQADVRPLIIDGKFRTDIPVYCDDCLDIRRSYKEEDNN